MMGTFNPLLHIITPMKKPGKIRRSGRGFQSFTRWK